MDVDKVLATIAIVATIFKAFTSGLKDLHDIKRGQKKKRRTPAKKKRRN
ncbi:hypothetical protein [Psychrobacillus sp. FSL K6-1267]